MLTLNQFFNRVKTLYTSKYDYLSGLDDSQLGKRLLLSCIDGDTYTVRYLLNQGVPIDTKDDMGITGLIFATAMNKTSLVKYLVSRGADKEATTRHGMTPLLMATEYRNLGLVKYFIRKGVCVDRANFEGMTSLTLACINGTLDICNVLLTNGANVDHRDTYGLTPNEHFERNTPGEIRSYPRNWLTRVNTMYRFSPPSVREEVVETIIKSVESTKGVGEECPICMSVMEMEESRCFLDCDHSFHTECLKEWVTKNNTCPLDRSKVSRYIKIG